MNVVEKYDYAGREALVAAVRDSRIVAIDYETTGLDPLTDTILLTSVTTEGGETWVVKGGTWMHAYLFLALQDKVIAAHNASFEWRFTEAYFGVEDELFTPRRWFCTAIAERLLTAGLLDKRADLGTVVQKYTGVALEGKKEMQMSFVGVNPDTFQPTEEQLAYAAEDTLHIHAIMDKQLAALEAENLMRAFRLEMNAMPAFADMMLSGFKLNVAKHKEVIAGYEERLLVARDEATTALQPLHLSFLRRENARRGIEWELLDGALHSLWRNGRVTTKTPDDIRARMGQIRAERNQRAPLAEETINLNSQQQVWNALSMAGVELYKDEFVNGEMVEKRSLDKFTVEENVGLHPVLRTFREYVTAAKVVGTYGETLRARIHGRTHRVHPEYKQMGADSGRASSSEPNGQNMPPPVRACFEAEHGNVLVVADAANQEGRLAAALSGDAGMLAGFRADFDWHSTTARAAFPHLAPLSDAEVKKSPERARAKNANFSSIYGGTAHTLLKRGYIDDLATGERLMTAVYETYPTLRSWSLATADHALNHGWVATISGRKRYFRVNPHPTRRFIDGQPEEWETFMQRVAVWKRRRGGIRRAAMNHPVQGSGADVMKQAMANLRLPMRDIGYILVAMVHDELVYEGPEDKAEEATALVLHHMEYAASCFVKNLRVPAEAHVTREWAK